MYSSKRRKHHTDCTGAHTWAVSCSLWRAQRGMISSGYQRKKDWKGGERGRQTACVPPKAWPLLKASRRETVNRWKKRFTDSQVSRKGQWTVQCSSCNTVSSALCLWTAQSWLSVIKDCYSLFRPGFFSSKEAESSFFSSVLLCWSRPPPHPAGEVAQWQQHNPVSVIQGQSETFSSLWEL